MYPIGRQNQYFIYRFTLLRLTFNAIVYEYQHWKGSMWLPYAAPIHFYQQYWKRIKAKKWKHTKLKWSDASRLLLFSAYRAVIGWLTTMRAYRWFMEEIYSWRTNGKIGGRLLCALAYAVKLHCFVTWAVQTEKPVWKLYFNQWNEYHLFSFVFQIFISFFNVHLSWMKWTNLSWVYHICFEIIWNRWRFNICINALVFIVILSLHFSISPNEQGKTIKNENLNWLIVSF